MPSATVNTYALFGAAMIMAVSVCALPISHVNTDKAAAAPIPPGPSPSCMLLNQTACFSNTCCNW